MSFTYKHPLDGGSIFIGAHDVPSADAGRVALDSWFDPEVRSLPLELEIGCGKGTFLVHYLQHAPRVRCVGIEWANKICLAAADRCRRHGYADRVRLVRTDADQFVTHQVSDHQFRAVHIYFPDPWPKKRHHKRRLIQEPFLRQVHRVLKPGGRLYLASDHDDYYAWMQEHVGRVMDIFERLPFTPWPWAGDNELVGTNYERKFKRSDRSANGMILVRK